MDVVETVIMGEDVLPSCGLGDTRRIVEGKAVLTGFRGCGFHCIE